MMATIGVSGRYLASVRDGHAANGVRQAIATAPTCWAICGRALLDRVDDGARQRRAFLMAREVLTRALGFEHDPGHVADGFEGYWPEAVSAESITASVPSKTALATSLASARVGVGQADHGLEHLGRRDDGHAELVAAVDQLLLDRRDALGADLDRHIAAGDEQAVGDLDDRLPCTRWLPRARSWTTTMAVSLD